MIALIPARAGSKRVAGKNTRELAGKPLVRWTVDAALETGLFPAGVVLATDEPPLFMPALEGLWRGCFQVVKRDPSPGDEKDVAWVAKVLAGLGASPEEELCLLRPTSPLRGPDTIRRALDQWEACKDRLDSLRAVRRTTETAWKQWVEEWDFADEACAHPEADGLVPPMKCSHPYHRYKTMVPLTTASAKKRLYEFPTQSLTTAYIQTGAIEIFRADLPLNHGNISGEQIGMFLTEGDEAIDVNTEDDWERAERALVREEAER